MKGEITVKSEPTKEEISWVRELAAGKTNNECAAEFGINNSTFAFYVAGLRKKYNCKNTVELVVLFKDNKLI